MNDGRHQTYSHYHSDTAENKIIWYARCSCGWTGPYRGTNTEALKDGAGHAYRENQAEAEEARQQVD